MKRIYRLLFLSLATMLMISCTENQRAKNYGGTADFDLPKGEKLINATWKGDDLWLLTEKRPTNVKPKTYYFREKSSFGMMNGTYVIHEK